MNLQATVACFQTKSSCCAMALLLLSSFTCIGHAQQQVNQQPLGQQPQQVTPIVPEGFNISLEHQQYVERILEIWEENSSKIKQLQCDFRRYDYDPSICNWRDPQDNRLAAAAVVEGSIRYENPDKALYEAESAWDFAGPPAAEGDQPKYVKRDEIAFHEKWICDGKGTYEFDYVSKRLYESEIPPEYQGQGLINSPMPFLFGANKKQILERFWVKTTTPQGIMDEYWLEIVPKRQSDAQNYTKVQIILAKADFLPNAIHVFSPGYNPKENQLASRYFQFSNRKINGQLAALQSFFQQFVRPSTPIGWTRVDKNAIDASASSENAVDIEIQRNLQNSNSSQIK